MLQKISKKLNSNRGATLLLALALFLVCAMVGSVVVAAAYTSAARYIQNKDAQQSYLSVMSAVRLMSDEVQGITFKASYSKTITEVHIPIYEAVPVEDEDGNPVLDDEGNPLSEVVLVGYDVQSNADDPVYSLGLLALEGNDFVCDFSNELVYSYIYYHAQPLYNGTDPGANIAENVKIVSEDFPQILGTLEVYTKDFDDISHFDIVLTMEDETGANATKMHFPSRTADTFEIEIKEGETEEGYYFKETTYIYRTTVNYLEPEITKGAGA